MSERGREKMEKITLTNDFHNSAVTLQANLGEWLSARQIQKARKALCGMQDCTCGGNLGERGKQAVDVDVADRNRIRLLAKQ